MAKIEASVVSHWFNLFDRILTPRIMRGVDRLIRDGLTIEKPYASKDDDSSIIFVATTGNGHKIKVKCVPTAQRTGIYDLYLKDEKGQIKSYPQIKDEEFDDKIVDFIESQYGEESLESGYKEFKDSKDLEGESEDFDIDEKSENVAESRKINVTLQTVKGSKKDDIHLVTICANYNASDAYQDLETALADSEFESIVTSSPQPQDFEIIPLIDGLEVNPLPVAVDPNEGFECLLGGMYNALLDVQYLSRQLCGPEIYTVLNTADSVEWLIQSHIRTINEFIGAEGILIDSPTKLLWKYGKPLDIPTNLTASESADILYGMLSDYKNLLDMYIVDFPDDMQSILEAWIQDIYRDYILPLKRIM